jgi:hypothetical protein
LKLNYNKEVIDIVQFGSSIIGGTDEKKENKPNDIDVAVFFDKIPLKEQLEEAQKIKKQLQEHSEVPIHVTSYDFYSFFDRGNFARESVLFYGKSLIHNDYFSKLFGFTPKIHISYSLNKLDKKDKVKFNYMLNGKGGNYGLLRKYNGKLLNPGLIEINPEHEHIFTNNLNKITKELKIKKVLLLEM